MNSFSTTSMSSKGQVVIPEKIRSQLNLKEGSKFIVVGEGDVIILKIINPPSLDNFDNIIQQARQQAKSVNLNQTDIDEAIQKARHFK
jgi:AbrB family looped-hinge helix DNA binding protein